MCEQTPATRFAAFLAAERAARTAAHALLYAQEVRRLLQTVRVALPDCGEATSATEAAGALCAHLEALHAARQREAGAAKAELERALGV